MKTLLVVYQSMTGGTEQMAHALAAGSATEDNVRTRLLHASEAQAEDVLDADGYVFATPENLAAISGLMKDFFDRCYYPALDRINGRPYAALICAGSDGQNAARQIDRIATGWRLRRVAENLIVCTHAQTPEEILALKTINEADLERCRELGTALATGLVLGVF
ncbi:MAG: NAD(P)H-dependent oxidoreductase [Pseudomonadota bacterium]